MKGARPLAGGFHAALPHWAPYHQLLPNRVLAMLHTGVRLEWNGEKPLPLWLDNHRMDASQSAFVDYEIQALLSTQAIKPYDMQRFGPPVCILPLLVTEDSSGEMRLCWDGRYTNSFLHKRRIKYETLEVLRLLVGPDRGEEDSPHIFKLDLKSGYHHLLMQAGTEPFLAFIWHGQVYYWHALPFGLSTAPEAFEFIMQSGFRKILRGPLKIPHMGYLDDTGAVVPHGNQLDVPLIVQSARAAIKARPHRCPEPAIDPVTILCSFLFFGCSINVAKLAFGTLVEMLGILFDTIARKTYVPQRRKDHLMPLLHQVVDAPAGSRVPVKLLAEISGQVVSMYAALIFAKQLLWAVFYTIYPYALAEQWHAKTVLPATVKQICQWWLQHFDEYNGRDFFEPAQYAFEWDAAEVGAGSVLYGNGQLIFGHVDRPMDERTAHNDVWELVAAPELLIPHVEILRGHRLSMLGDNMFAVSYLKRGGGPNPYATAMVQLFFQWLIQEHIELVSVRHLAGSLNWVADWISRFQDYTGDWALSDEAWEVVQHWWQVSRLPPPNFEAFALALNHRLPRWCSRWVEPGAEVVDFFSYPGKPEDIMWINPPFGLMLRTLLQVAYRHLTAYLVMPHWPEKPWWLPAWKMASSYLQLPPAAFTTIRTAHTAGYRDPGYPIYVLAINMADCGDGGLEPPNHTQA